MRCSDCIDIMLLHQDNIFFNFFFCNYTSVFWIKVMTIHTFELNCNAVDKECVTVEDDIAETDILWNDFNYLSIFFCCQIQLVQIRALCRPFFRIFHVLAQFKMIFASCSAFFKYKIAVVIIKCSINDLSIRFREPTTDM